MKYLRSFNENIDRTEIATICEKYGIINYTINEDGSIDVDGDVDLSEKRLYDIPLKFRNVSGWFNCADNFLTTLDNSPISVDRTFICSRNKLTNLIGAPQYVGIDFYCTNNRIESKLTSLKGAPKNVSGGFYCTGNKLITLEGGPKYVGIDFDCSMNHLTSLKGIPKKINGTLDCYYNNLKNIDYLPICNKLNINNNPIGNIFSFFQYDLDLIYDFKERDIIEDDILILDRLVEFLEDYDHSYTKKYLYQYFKNEYETR